MAQLKIEFSNKRVKMMNDNTEEISIRAETESNNNNENEKFFTENYLHSEVIITEMSDDEEFNNEIKSTSSGSIEYLVEEPIGSFKNENGSSFGVTKKASFMSNNTGESESIEEDNEAAEVENNETFQYVYMNNEYYNEYYVKNPLVRNISLSKWPNVGFGFKLNRSNDKKLYYINEIIPNSPAESCLTIGDLIIELDEYDNPFNEFSNLNEVEAYLNEKEAIHLLALEGSNYLKFNLDRKPLKNYCRNCEDIVIVSWNELKHE